MRTKTKQRVNLYVDSELIEFGKKFSFVINASLSKLIEVHLNYLKGRVENSTPEIFMADQEEMIEQYYYQSGQAQRDNTDAVVEFLEDEEEIRYCKSHPNSSRAKLRIQLVEEQKKRMEKELKEQAQAKAHINKLKAEFIDRWKETF